MKETIFKRHREAMDTTTSLGKKQKPKKPNAYRNELLDPTHVLHTPPKDTEAALPHSLYEL